MSEIEALTELVPPEGHEEESCVPVSLLGPAGNCCFFPLSLHSHGNIPECPYLLHPPKDTRVTRSRPTQFQYEVVLMTPAVVRFSNKVLS